MTDTPSPDPHPDRPSTTAPPASRRAARAARLGQSGDAAGTPAPVSRPAPLPGAETPDASPTPTPPERVEPMTPRPGSIDALFEEDPPHVVTPGAHDKDRRKSRVAAWVVFAIVLALLGGVAVGAVTVWNTYETQIREFLGWAEPKDYEDGLAEGEATVTVADGDTGADISRTLHDAGVTKTADAFYRYLVETGRSTSSLVPGVFSLQQKMTSEAAYDALTDPSSRLENTAQLREGLTLEQSLERLADGVGIARADLDAAVADPSAFGVEGDSLEGWLFPATYSFDPDVTAEDVIRTLVNRTVRSLDDAGVPAERRHEILTIASIIEREARYEEDFYKVSRVIQNRLQPDNGETNGLLQMDSTAQYGYAEMHDGTVSSSAAALEDDNPWNTYRHPGLPKGPIANAGDRAIDAAMNPADGPWLYFVTVDLSTGETVFTETYAEHQRAVEKWRAWCRDNPDGGC